MSLPDEDVEFLDAYARSVGASSRAEQVRSVAVQRVGRRVGQLPASLVSDLEDALRLHLGL